MFTRKNSKWLKNYALYMAVKNSFDMKSWTEWPEDIKMREPEALARYERRLRKEISFWKFVQFKFYEQWESFRAYVNGLGIKILGDMPIYVAMDSADTWANPEIFQLYDDGDPIAVATTGITSSRPTTSGGLSVSRRRQSSTTSPVSTTSAPSRATTPFLIPPRTLSTASG